jgi:O-antigen/teichoic acid export membrane protein
MILIKALNDFDESIFYTISARLIQVLGTLVNIFIISLYLSKEEQGFYFTFGSIIGIQIFFELGLNTILVQFVAHEKVHVTLTDNHELVGNPENISRLSSLLRFCISIFSKLSIVLFLLLNVIGYFFFKKFTSNVIEIKWQLPWVLLCFSTSMMLMVN